MTNHKKIELIFSYLLNFLRCCLKECEILHYCDERWTWAEDFGSCQPPVSVKESSKQGIAHG